MDLPIKSLMILKNEWIQLQKDVWSDKFVHGYFIHQSGKEPILVRYRGGHTREYPKKSFEIRRGAKTLHLNAEYDDPSMIRNALSFAFFEWIGVPSPKTQHCVLELNGEKLGVYLEIEGVDALFFQSRKLACKSLIYAVNDDANFSLICPDNNKFKRSLFDGYELQIGNSDDRRRLETFIHNINTLKNSELTSFLQDHLDIDNYLRWLAGAVCTGNYDGFDQNYAIYKCLQTGHYRMIPWDYEGTWGRNCYGKPCRSNLVSAMGYNMLTKKLLGRKHVRDLYQEILTEILKASFTEERIGEQVDQLHASILQQIQVDLTRKWPFSVFKKEPRVIRSYIQERRSIIQHALKK